MCGAYSLAGSFFWTGDQVQSLVQASQVLAPDLPNLQLPPCKVLRPLRTKGSQWAAFAKGN